jgi:polyadenylate-binding protein
VPQIGKIQSIRILRDAITRQSLGYAYVNYYDTMDAERAIEILNFQPINGKPCRVMWVQRDPSLRKSGVGNVVIKNLDPSIDNKTLFDTFSVFGNILSCKVQTDDEGRSKGFGFVHFDLEESAQGCIRDVNGKLINGKQVTVEAFKRGHKGEAQWTNLYVKNFPLDWDSDKLKEIFGAYGEITSAKVEAFLGEDARAKGVEGKSRGFGFVNFAEHESAVKASEELDGKTFMEGETEKTLYVRRLQTKKERSKELRDKHAMIKKDRLTKYQGCNLYIKNLDETATDDWLRQTFGKFGTITSARIMRDQVGTSRGFGFVCFSSPEEASKAIAQMNNKMCLGKPIYVALSQAIQARREMLAVTFSQQQQQQRGVMPPMQGAPFGYGPNAGMMPQPPYGMNMGPYGAGPMRGPGGMMGNRAMHAMGNMGGMRPIYRLPNYNRGGNPGDMGMEPRQPKGFRGPRSGRQGQGGPGPQSGPQGGPQGQGVRGPGAGPYPGQQVPPGVSVPGAVPIPRPMPGPGPMPPGQADQAGQPVPVPSAFPEQQDVRQQVGGIDHQRLASASVEDQKAILGERLYPEIFNRQPDLAGKITGMILELDNTEILHLIESPDSLEDKIREAIQVLEDYSSKIKPETSE